GQLIVYLKECENIKEELNGIEYKRNDLEKIIRSYYSCIGEDVKFYRESEPFLIDFGVIMGFTVSQLNYQKIDNREVVKTLSDSNNPLIGFSIEFTLPRNLGKWSFYNSFYYTNYKFKSTYNYFKNDRNYYISETKMESDFIKVLNYIRYKYYRGNIDLFINAGITNGFPISTVITTQKTGIYYSREFENLYDIHNDFRSFENGIAIGTGINWKHIQMEIHIEKTINKSKFQSNSALVTRCEGVINYTF
ncbi:MAG: hypothetical protein OEW75_18605, partial [Cyclobacteriaceae bacterium]|nr:hypothetical protein [Cyclobacteriaceae bacterium]